MNFEEFLKDREEPASVAEPESAVEEANLDENIDVQKAVVESLAADKAVQDEKIAKLEANTQFLQAEKQNLLVANQAQEAQIAGLKAQLELLNAEKAALQSQLQPLQQQVQSLQAELAQEAESSMSNLSNRVALLDREVELQDRFPGETRDHVLEVIKEARDAAEADGRLRRAQVLEAVLVANEACGELKKRREELVKLFADNQNIVNGVVINTLDNDGISYKVGESYLLPAEIIKRTY